MVDDSDEVIVYGFVYFFDLFCYWFSWYVRFGCVYFLWLILIDCMYDILFDLWIIFEFYEFEDCVLEIMVYK